MKSASPTSAPASAPGSAPQNLVRPLVLGIETSCDDTACAILDGRGRVLASVVSSQLAHQQYGGVVPEVASRAHLENWPTVSAEAFRAASVRPKDIDIVAATRGPGLVGSLMVGLQVGKAMAFALNKPFHGVHHLEAHLFSPFLAIDGDSQDPPESFVGLVASGGHTNLFSYDSEGLTTLSQTRDDAMGECFDKVGKRLGLLFPAGALVDALAEHGDPKAHPFRVPRCGDSLDVSYSGIKTQALIEIDRLEREGVATELAGLTGAGQDRSFDMETVPKEVRDLLAGFRKAAVEQVMDRLKRLGKRQPFARLAVSGGAAANRLLRRRLTDWAKENGITLHLVPLVYSGDRPARIAWSALLRTRRGVQDDPLATIAESRIPI